MTNEELCKRLRLLNELDAFAAADRIEALVRDMASGSFYKEADIDALMAERDRAKANLAKVVAAARAYRIATKHLRPCPETSAGLDTALAEIGGEA